MGMAPGFLMGQGGVSSPVTSGGAAPAGAPGALAEFSAGISDVMSGRMSLLILDTLILALLGFYLWTRNAQGGG
jgi:hypothetical protein